MTTSVHHVNPSDASFMQEMIGLLRTWVRDAGVVDTMFGRHSGDPQLRLVARETSASADRQITAMISCLDDWNAETRTGTRRRARVDAAPAATAGTVGDDDKLADLHGSQFDARVARDLLAHHRAVIARSRQEMIEGLNPESRDIASAAISQHSGELRRLEARLVRG